MCWVLLQDSQHCSAAFAQVYLKVVPLQRLCARGVSEIRLSLNVKYSIHAYLKYSICSFNSRASLLLG